MKTGGIASVAAIGGVGLGAMSGAAAAQSGVTINAGNPSQISNDRGDLTQVTINPDFRVEWDNFDTAVGKVMILIEARTRENGSVQGAGWTPVFRMTPWLTENVKQNGGPHVDYSKPGTTGYYEITSSLGEVVSYAARHRTSSGTPKARPIEVVNEVGRPDYTNDIDYPGSISKTSFLAGDSIGAASDYSNEPSLVNNFPGAGAGYYGAAINTDEFDVDKDGTSDADTVELRYTLAFYTASWPSESEVGSGWLENVRESDLQTDGSGNSKLVMNGADGYPNIKNHGASSSASNHYGALQSIASSHPSVMVSETDFNITVSNEESSTSGTGSTNAGASGGGQ